MCYALRNDSAIESRWISRLYRVVKNNSAVCSFHHIGKHAHGTLVSGNDTILGHIVSAKLHACPNAFDVDIGVINANK